MGTTGSKIDEASTPPDYYEVLGVLEDAKPEQIKKAYYRLCLIHHPDKNVDDVEAATARFAQIQTAYEVLSDEQERAWYDSHKASLVPEPDAEAVLSEIRTGTSSKPRSFDRGLTTKHIQAFFAPGLWNGYTDDERGVGFYSFFRNIFDRLAAEEAAHGSDILYPVFGDSTWTWASSGPDDTITSVQYFYASWTNFVSVKSFSWLDRAADFSDRKLRRAVERENQRSRENARREYVDSVRDLAKYVRKRDPRYKRFQQDIKRPSQVPNDTKTARKVSPEHQEYVEQDWQKIIPPDDANEDYLNDDPLEEWECLACDKTFRSEAALNSHERSKKHLKAVEMLKQEMVADDAILGLQEELDTVHLEEPPIMEMQPDYTSSLSTDMQETVASKRRSQNAESPDLPIPALSDEPRKPEPIAEEGTTSGEPISVIEEPPTESSNRPDKPPRRRRKQPKQDSDQKLATNVCNVCRAGYSSRTQLFAHLREADHALHVDGGNGEKATRRRKK